EMKKQEHKIQRYLMAIEYIGSRFFGSQKQLTDRTVVGVLEVILLSVM
ncbi:tRNA pseudouridine synthase-like 1, partial [Trifolium medium]|nr:tRNA pseudouridine synthase-like 1 [Trifolium medium]